MSTWEERMAARTVDRAHKLALTMHPEESAAAEKREAARAAWAEFVEERGGYFPWVTERGEFSHGHYAHGNATFDAATGDLMGVFTAVFDEDAPPPPDVCPICRDFKPEEWLG